MCTAAILYFLPCFFDVTFKAHWTHSVRSFGFFLGGGFLRFRAISVLLGEKWKKMRSEERRVFTTQAKALADEQKRLNPDCWKRKRTNSVRRCTQNHAPSEPRSCGFSFLHRQNEWYCRVPTYAKNQATHAHTLLNLVLFFSCCRFFCILQGCQGN